MNRRLAYVALAALLSTFACVGCAADGTASSEADVQQSAASSSDLGDKVVVDMPNGDVREGLADLGMQKIDEVTNENMNADSTLMTDKERARFNQEAATADEAKPNLGLVTQEQFPSAVYKKY